MAKRLILMIEVKEVLYRWTQGMGKKTIARSLGLGRNTIREILNQAMGFGLQKDSPIEILDEVEWNGYLITHGDKYDGVVKLKWLGILGSIGYEIAIYIDRTLKKMGYQKSFSKTLKNKVKGAVKFITDFEKQLGYQAHIRGAFRIQHKRHKRTFVGH